MLEECCCDKITWDRFALFINVETEQYHGNNVVTVIRQIVKAIGVTILARIK